jgi:lysophospholipase L1-like esterase
VEPLRCSWFVLLATLIGCSSGLTPDDGGAGGSGPASTSGTGGNVNAAGQNCSGVGGGTVVGGAGPSTGGSAPAGATSGGADAGDASGGTAMAAGTGGAWTSGGAGGTASVDPDSLPNVTLHLAGDSTVMTYAADSAQEGWGQELPQFLLSKVALDNQAIGGASVESFYTGRWKNVMSNLKAGDYVMAAFGANDSGTVAGRHVDPPDFQKRFEIMAEEVMAKKATFIAVTPSALQEWSGGQEGNQRLGPYVTVLHTFAESKGVKLADLNARSIEFLNQLGQEAAKEIYIGGDKAHFTKKGATKMAELLAHELSRIGSPLGAYVK